jgi:acyl carrier protein
MWAVKDSSPGSSLAGSGGARPLLGTTASISEFTCALYAHVLGRAAVAPEDDFFADLNGDSLAAAQVIVVLEDLFEIDVVEEFFDNSSAAAITTILQRHLRSRPATDHAWSDGSSLLGDALGDELTRLRQSFSPDPDRPCTGS